MAAPVAINSKDVDAFLASCAASGDAAYDAAKAVLQRLQDPASRAAARRLLGAVRRRFADGQEDECARTFHFRFRDVVLDPHHQGSQQRKKLTMMEITSIFISEELSFTFYEGLNQLPDPVFRDKTVAELECGNGWISIALAEKWSPLKVYGLDINARVIKIAWINLYLNALDEDGLPIYDGEGKTLLDRVEFHESDLLAYCRDNKIELDHIVGCIPQILNPNPEAMSNIITEKSSDTFLYSLNNYYDIQSFAEDQFGLGLIARAVEEGIANIKPMGIMIFNMGCRPGQGICERLFLRRGLRINKLWQTKIMQATDADISALVEIEKLCPHRFEFFMDLHGDQPVSARTALAYMRSGGRVSHAFSVYSCQLRQPNQVKKLFEIVKNGLHEVSSPLDLSFDDDSVVGEKISFLVYLASLLKDNKPIPYEPPAGCLNFRNLVAEFMNSYHHIPLTPDNVVVFPSLDVAIESSLRLFSPALAIVDEHLTRQLPKQWLTSSEIEIHKKGGADCSRAADAVAVIEAPCQSDLLIELVRKLKPQVVVAGIAHFEVYSGMEVAFAISGAAVCEALSQTIELLEGHTCVISQHYYGCLFHELLAFQIGDHPPQQERQPAEVKPQMMIGFSNSARSTLKEAEFFVPDSKDSSVIHMDLDRSFLTVPSSVNVSIFESFVRQNITDSQTDVRSSIEKLVGYNYGFPGEDCPDIAEVSYRKEIMYGSTCLALFNKLVLCCMQEQGTFLFPFGTNGHYVKLAKFLNAKTLTIPTNVDSGFKIEPMALDAALEDAYENKNVTRAWVYISGPTINPSGFLYSDGEIKDLLSVCARRAARVVIDISFSGLEFQTDGWSQWNLSTLSYDICLCPPLSYFMLGELSLELTTAGLEFGFLISSKPSDVEVSFRNLSQPHSTLKYTFRKLLGLSQPHSTLKHCFRELLGVKNECDGLFPNLIREQKEKLKSRANKLTKTLESCGWDVAGGHGGISMLAKPTAYIGRSFKMDGFEGELDGCNIREAILRSTGLCISSSKWTGIPDYCRFSFALESSEFDRAMDCIVQFRELVLGDD
ncbi:hypothetical protein ACQ4PT_054799 [Festuca glaucescens]